jgi:ribosome recycling factor
VTETETDLAKELRISAEQDKARSEQHRRDAVEEVQAKKRQKTTGNNPGQTSPSRRGKTKDKADKTSPNRGTRRRHR